MLVCDTHSLPVEDWNCARDYGSQDHGNPGMITSDGRECCCAQAWIQSGHVRRRNPKSGGCFSLTDLVVVQHMCLSGFDRLDTLIQNPVYSFNSFTCRGIVQLSQDVFNKKDKQGLDPIYVLVIVIV